LAKIKIPDLFVLAGGRPQGAKRPKPSLQLRHLELTWDRQGGTQARQLGGRIPGLKRQSQNDSCQDRMVVVTWTFVQGIAEFARIRSTLLDLVERQLTSTAKASVAWPGVR